MAKDALDFRLGRIANALPRLALPKILHDDLIKVELEHKQTQTGFRTKGERIFINPVADKDLFYFNLVCATSECFENRTVGKVDRSEAFYSILDKFLSTAVFYNILPESLSLKCSTFSEYEKKYGKVAGRLKNERQFDDFLEMFVVRNAYKYKDWLLKKNFVYSPAQGHMERSLSKEFSKDLKRYLEKCGIEYQIEDNLYLNFISKITIYGLIPDYLVNKLKYNDFRYNSETDKYAKRLPIAELELMDDFLGDIRKYAVGVKVEVEP